MKVKELQKALSEFPSDMDVLILKGESYLYDIRELKFGYILRPLDCCIINTHDTIVTKEDYWEHRRAAPYL